MTTWTVPATVDHVVDGDTVHLVLDLGWHIFYRSRVRVARINAPELSTPAGVVARDYAAELLPAGAPVTFASRALDKFGRPLGDIRMGDGSGASFADLMLVAGHAVPYGGG